MAESFADRLERLRMARGLTQPALADLAEVSLASLRNWERARREPTLSAGVKLARALGVSLDLLAGDVAEITAMAEPKRRGRPSQADLEAAPEPVPAKRRRARRKET